MKKLISFENNDIQVIQINDVWHFDLYSVGMALGQVVTAKGNVYPNKTRIDKNVKNAEIKPVLHNAKPYITEEQVYDLMLETRTDKCRVFRKWLTNEVLPELNHTGKYEMQKPDPKPYEYLDKTYNGEPVLTAVDIEHLTGISRNNTDYQAKHNLNNGKDYFLLVKNELKKFKQENPKVNRLASSIIIITQSGFKKLCNIYCVTVEEPKCFEKRQTKEQGFACFSPNVDVKQLMERVRNKAMQVNALTYLLSEPNISGFSSLHKGNLRYAIMELNMMIEKIDQI